MARRPHQPVDQLVALCHLNRFVQYKTLGKAAYNAFGLERLARLGILEQLSGRAMRRKQVPLPSYFF